MEKPIPCVNPQLLTVIVNCGLGTKVVRLAKTAGITRATIIIGHGTIRNRVLEFFELSEVRKEIVIMLAGQTEIDAALTILKKELHLEKPYHGIGFTVAVSSFLGLIDRECIINKPTQGEVNMYNVIFIIADKGKAEEAMSAATEAGAKGGTIINARGSGINETMKVFNIEIEPEKEILLIVAKDDICDNIIAAVNEKLEIEQPGKGIIFVQKVDRIVGIKE